MNNVLLHPGVITIQQNKILEKYSLDIDKDKYPDTTLGDIKKFRDFWAKQDQQKKTEIILDISKLFLYTLAPAIARCTFSGAIIGGGIGAIACNAPGIAPGAILGAKLGATIGTLAGIDLLCKDIKIVVLKSTVYNEWTTKAKLKDVYNIYTKIIQDDGSFDEYICTITNDFPSIPVKSPHGHLYDKQAIDAWIDQKEKQISIAIESGSKPQYIKELKDSVCPRRNGQFSKDDLEYQKDFFVRLNKVIKDKLKENECDQSTWLFREGLDNLACANQENRMNIIYSQIGRMYMFCEVNGLPGRIADIAKNEILHQYRKDLI